MEPRAPLGQEVISGEGAYACRLRELEHGCRKDEEIAYEGQTCPVGPIIH